MKKKPKKLEDLLVNESFLNYYFRKNEADIWEWEAYQEEFPISTTLITEAQQVLNKLSLKWSENEIREKFFEFQSQIIELEEDVIQVKRPFFMP